LECLIAACAVRGDNVVIILLDDVGFGQPGTLGSPVPAPNIDKLAAEGLRFIRFHTVGVCSPSRAALLTGRNHHKARRFVLTSLAWFEPKLCSGRSAGAEFKPPINCLKPNYPDLENGETESIAFPMAGSNSLWQTWGAALGPRPTSIAETLPA
jgi:hypothetical protein